MLTPEIITQLKKPFTPEQHKDRALKGGGTWFYIPWQLIRDRVEEVDPNYETEYGEPKHLDKYCWVTCTLIIHEVSRQAIGNAEIELLSSTGKNMERGNCIERAIADAFKNAAEAFGIAAYLDDQEAVIRILSGKGDQRAYKYAKDQQQIGAGLPPIHGKQATPAKVAPTSVKPANWKPSY
jgi:hypothetical protein